MPPLGPNIITSLLKVVILLALLPKGKRLDILIKIGLKLDPIWERHLKWKMMCIDGWASFIKVHASRLRSSNPIISGVFSLKFEPLLSCYWFQKQLFNLDFNFSF
jgi:hypothetical protein